MSDSGIRDAIEMAIVTAGGAALGRSAGRRMGRKAHNYAKEELDNANQINEEASHYNWEGRAIDPRITGDHMAGIQRRAGQAVDRMTASGTIGGLAGGAAGAATDGAFRRKMKK